MSLSDDGLCWLKSCKVTGTELQVGHYRIVLCATHRALLEESAQGGYSQALPPPPGEGVPTFDRANWWPWDHI